MSMIAGNPKLSVVSVWSGSVNLGRKNGFIGSAFFITPSLLLTAKHVVRDKNTDQLFNDLRLGLVSGRSEVMLKPDHIYCHDRLDIALIRLEEPDDEQLYCELDFTNRDFRSQTIGYFGVNDTNKSRDASLNHTTGIIDQPHDAYRFDHRVKKGFSGGAVALNNQAKTIGVICQRDREDQETLFIPVYKCRDWFSAINASLNDPVLTRYLQTNSLVQTSHRQHKSIPDYFNDTVLFIGRPQTAYQHILDQLLNDETPKPVKACLCLYQSAEDSPTEFGDALGCRLETRVKKQLNSDLLKAESAYILEHLQETSPWDFDKKEDFFIACLKNIVECLSLDVDASKFNKAENLCQAVLAQIATKKVPIILISDNASKPVKLSWLTWFNKPTIARINQRCEWIESFNQLWLEHCKSGKHPTQQLSLALIFCLRADSRLAAAAKHCFQLQKITKQDFISWTNQLQKLLRDSNHFVGREVGDQVSAFTLQFVNAHGGETSDFQISYRQFKDQIKIITHRMNTP